MNKKLASIVAIIFVIVLGGIVACFLLWGDESVKETVKETVGIGPDHKIELKSGDKTYTLDLKKVGYDGKDAATIDKNAVEKWIWKEVKKEVEEPPKNAKMKRIGDPIQPEKAGRVMDENKVRDWLKDLTPLIDKTTEIPMKTKEPQVTTKDLKNVNKKKISGYTTYFDSNNTNRNTNIRLAAKAMDRIVVNPGETFSFNKETGPHNAARGYKPATVIVKGEFTQGVGGGICQVSSTLYNSVDRAGLKITRLQHHSKSVTYVPVNRDATVSDGGPDFAFKNNYDKPIAIRVSMDDNSLTVKIYSVPELKPNKRSVPDAPKKSQIKQEKVKDPTKPNAELPKDDKVPDDGSKPNATNPDDKGETPSTENPEEPNQPDQPDPPNGGDEKKESDVNSV
ncbi:VanW family protein [Thermoflavimicrobium dichotomicum]|uniref:Vancomycin resistance protein YoaR, contains peptidoglycan-binding and VanW domains n=1 Tax=Thermoflavimicrobium dichotomicum TaxID=46223 RepID=A0A1I3JEU5_9BACL|nr:VanW family protein [Thermoflavimicrobium dichotomicum]SFI58666.1 Vancomycin resistance protein YoaR, contains peptidoglycan-binding and VanW domains [Thermoflavimicrobium dichotomicum]